ncbi:tRNA (uridine(54)-C5)-methyltransferase TrmA [Candidatus Endobugula sertula]|uniref:tRNA/tmRNA (uracil-C(5))-methyltransferase n=1 Tax=Candidatus Endobugula sertula TaxID=62101 RepID=A0MS21_9GAMM|nr:BryS [Candidatus Endobugula sertula]ODS25129.1 tRNA (uridine(54)-C5)-methyltransferase TrmA [Candidatus Endobugula sertula]
MKPFSTYPDQYQQQLDNKVNIFKDQLTQLNHNMNVDHIAVYNSPHCYYRMRAEFKVWHTGNTSHYAMYDKNKKEPVFLEKFPVAAQSINQLMPLVMAEITQHEMLRKKLFQIEFLTTQTNDTLVSLIYHKSLNEQWVHTISPIKDKLGINIIGRSRKQKMILDRDFVNEELTVNGKIFYYQQNEGSFTQPNAKVCEKMLAWAVNNSKNNHGDLLELYCGNGNFTLPLSQNFNRVIATEVSKSSVHSAQKNIQKNNIDNVSILRMSSEDFSLAIDKIRPFRRLKEYDLESYHFSTVFVDPPRAGLDDGTIEMIKRFENIIYISCNPKTLINNLDSLCRTHNIEALAAFDQFPYTEHLEAGVILKKK